MPELTLERELMQTCKASAVGGLEQLKHNSPKAVPSMEEHRSTIR